MFATALLGFDRLVFAATLLGLDGLLLAAFTGLFLRVTAVTELSGVLWVCLGASSFELITLCTYLIGTCTTVPAD